MSQKKLPADDFDRMTLLRRAAGDDPKLAQPESYLIQTLCNFLKIHTNAKTARPANNSVLNWTTG